MRGGAQLDKGPVVWQNQVKDVLWCQEEIISVLVVAEDSKLLDNNDVIFKSLFSPF